MAASPPETRRRSWTARIVEARRLCEFRLRVALTREWARVAEEAAAGVRDFAAHRDRLAAILAANTTATATVFGLLAAGMLKTALEAKQADPDPVRAVLRRIVALRVDADNVEAVVDDLMRSAVVVAAVAGAIALSPGDLDVAAAAAAAKPVVRRAVAVSSAKQWALRALTDAGPVSPPPPPVENAPRPGQSPPSGGSGGGSPPAPPAPPPPAPPPGDEPPREPPRGPFRERVARIVRDQAQTRPRQLADRTRAIVQEELRQAALKGEGPEKIAYRLKRALTGEVGVRRAMVIARTEIGAAQNAALLEMAEARGVPFVKVWAAVDDARTRPSHHAADGQRAMPREHFRVGSARLMYPGDPAAPPGEIINCFPASTRVATFGEVRKVYRRAYEGAVVRVKTASGNELIGTPNHPVLTANGWKSLGEITEGDQLLRHPMEDRTRTGEQEPDRRPATIAEAYDLATQLGVRQRVAGARPDFHGDGSYNEVEIVAVERDLRARDNATALQRLDQLALTHADVCLTRLASDGGSSDFLLGPGAPPNGRVSGGRASLALGRTRPPSAHEASLALTAGRDPALNEAETDDVPAHLEVAGQGELTSASQILTRDAVTLVSVERAAHDVFNLETETGLYLANGFVVSNCRCTMTFEPVE